MRQRMLMLYTYATAQRAKQQKALKNLGQSFGLRATESQKISRH